MNTTNTLKLIFVFSEKPNLHGKPAEVVTDELRETWKIQGATVLRKSLLAEARPENGSGTDQAGMKSKLLCLRNRKTFNCDWKVPAGLFATT